MLSQRMDFLLLAPEPPPDRARGRWNPALLKERQTESS
jgi:hypothetical protein